MTCPMGEVIQPTIKHDCNVREVRVITITIIIIVIIIITVTVTTM
jgi:transcriptional regulator of met regulon